MNTFKNLLLAQTDQPEPAMALYQRAPYTTADNQQLAEDVSDQEEEALVNDYKQQVSFADDGMEELEHVTSQGGGLQNMQAQLEAAATPLEYQATLETKFASYDNYCSLFHYILNSEGPVDLDVPTVRCLSLYSYGLC
jgi:translation initiation factor 3 subunit L